MKTGRTGNLQIRSSGNATRWDAWQTCNKYPVYFFESSPLELHPKAAARATFKVYYIKDANSKPANIVNALQLSVGDRLIYPERGDVFRVVDNCKIAWDL